MGYKGGRIMIKTTLLFGKNEKECVWRTPQWLVQRGLCPPGRSFIHGDIESFQHFATQDDKAIPWRRCYGPDFLILMNMTWTTTCSLSRLIPYLVIMTIAAKCDDEEEDNHTMLMVGFFIGPLVGLLFRFVGTVAPRLVVRVHLLLSFRFGQRPSCY